MPALYVVYFPLDCKFRCTRSNRYVYSFYGSVSWNVFFLHAWEYWSMYHLDISTIIFWFNASWRCNLCVSLVYLVDMKYIGITIQSRACEYIYPIHDKIKRRSVLVFCQSRIEYITNDTSSISNKIYPQAARCETTKNNTAWFGWWLRGA